MVTTASPQISLKIRNRGSLDTAGRNLIAVLVLYQPVYNKNPPEKFDLGVKTDINSHRADDCTVSRLTVRLYFSGPNESFILQLDPDLDCGLWTVFGAVTRFCFTKYRLVRAC